MFHTFEVPSIVRQGLRHGAIDTWRLGACCCFAAILIAEMSVMLHLPRSTANMALGLAAALAVAGMTLIGLASRWSRRWHIRGDDPFGSVDVRRMRPL